LKLYLTISFLLISVSGFSIVNKAQIDSLKKLLASSLNRNAIPDTVNINRLNKLAADYFESSPDSTLYYARESIALSRKIDYKAGIANGLLQMGHADYFVGKFGEAEKELDEAIIIYNSLKDKKGLADCYTVYGRLYNLLANYKLALKYLTRSLDIYKGLKK
jgi:two-component system sensor histidine kinase/response regulator